MKGKSTYMLNKTTQTHTITTFHYTIFFSEEKFEEETKKKTPKIPTNLTRGAFIKVTHS